MWMGAAHFPSTGSFGEKADILSPRLAPTLRDGFPYQESRLPRTGSGEACLRGPSAFPETI